MPHPAMETLRTKMGLIEFWRSDKGPTYGEALREVTSLRMEPRYTPAGIASGTIDATAFAATMVKRLNFATPYWVDSDMVDLTVLASESRPLDPIHVEDMPTQHGFVVLDRPAELRFVDPLTGEYETLTIRAFLWDQGMNVNGEPGVAITYWSDTTDRRDSLAALLEENKVNPFRFSGRLVVATVCFLPYGHTYPEQYWWAALPATFFNLISQPITTTTQAPPPDRVLRKQMTRQNVDFANTVAIITLRRRSAPPVDAPDRPEVPEDQKRRLTVRSMVGERTGGFWRRQHTKDGIKTVFIAPFIRGPEGAPFVIRKDKIYAWKR